MIERRADGTIPGAPLIGRIYKFSHDGCPMFHLIRVERESDAKMNQIEKSPMFGGYTTEFMPLDQATQKLEELGAIGFTPEECEVEMAKHLKRVFLEAHRVAEKAAHAYFTACPVGDERIRASEIYENIRNSIRV